MGDESESEVEKLKAHVEAKLTELGERLKRRLDPELSSIVDDEIDLVRADLAGP